MNEQSELARLQDENERLRNWLEPEAFCPCCGSSESCEPDCTFAINCPNEHEKMAAVRELLR